jgi:hypothetical protein
MGRRGVIALIGLLAGCAGETKVIVEPEAPARISTDFGRLPSVLQGIGKSTEVALYEGLPSEFWEPQLREEEAKRKKTIRLHGYAFYEDRVALSSSEAQQFTALFLSKGSYKRYRAQKPCGGYHPDYCVEWNSSDAVTRALICLECGEVKFFGPGSELHCDLIPEAGERIARRLTPYQKNRPNENPRG